MMKAAYVLVSILSLVFVILLFLPFPWDNPYGYGFLGELVLIDLIIFAIGSVTLIVNGEKGKDVVESLYIISVPLVHILGSMMEIEILLVLPSLFILYKGVRYFMKPSNRKRSKRVDSINPYILDTVGRLHCEMKRDDLEKLE